MKRTHPFMVALRYLPVIPVTVYHIIAELIGDLIHYLFGRRREVRWPEPTAASSLLPSTH